MAAHPIPGLVYLAPTTAAVGGTQVRGILNDRMEFDDGTEVVHYGAGLEADNWTTVRKPGAKPAMLMIPVRDVSSTTLQLLFQLLSTGSQIDSQGGNATEAHGSPPGVALVVRPRDTTQKYLYGSRWVMHEDTEKRLVWSRTVPHFDGSTIVLTPERSLDGTKKAFMFAAAAAINTHYGLSE